MGNRSGFALTRDGEGEEIVYALAKAKEVSKKTAKRVAPFCEPFGTAF